MKTKIKVRRKVVGMREFNEINKVCYYILNLDKSKIEKAKIYNNEFAGSEHNQKIFDALTKLRRLLNS